MADITVEISTGTITVDASVEMVTLDTGAQGATGPLGESVVLAVSAEGTLRDGELLVRHIFVSTIEFANDFDGSYASSDTASAGTAVLSITKNGVEVGTLTFTASTEGIFATSGGAVTFIEGDVLKIIAPATADASLANVSISLLGTR